MYKDPVIPHKTVLIKETLQYLAIKPHGVYLDVTFGAGGHSRAILESDSTVQVIGLDWDKKTLDEYGAMLEQEFPGRFRALWGSFGQLYKIAKKEGIKDLDGILADFGASQMQIRESEGFSFTHNTPLDMRMSPAHQKLTARAVVNESSPATLKEIFQRLGQEPYARQIAEAIVEERKNKPIEYTVTLADIIARVKPRGPKTSRINPATQVFQALRMHVNQELENIENFIPVAIDLLKPTGRLVCITFHSLEDRLVKQLFRDEVAQGESILLTKKAVTASEEELRYNKSARSAQLRVLEKV